MALTRCQLLAGNQSQGTVLVNQPQGVTAGVGVTIASNGAISFDPSTATGIVKTNNVNAFNQYIWPSTTGSAGQTLTLGSSNALSWVSHLPLTGGTMTGTVTFTALQVFDGGTFGT